LDAFQGGAKPICLVYIKEAWTDMKPLSQLKKMDKSVREA